MSQQTETHTAASVHRGAWEHCTALHPALAVSRSRKVEAAGCAHVQVCNDSNGFGQLVQITAPLPNTPHQQILLLPGESDAVSGDRRRPERGLGG